MNEDRSPEHYMQEALALAIDAAAADEVPIGAVLVDRQSGKIVARGRNRTREKNDPTAHAEIEVIRALCNINGAQRIPGYDLYVTLEPCPMCAAAISYARIDHLYFGASDPKSGGVKDGPKLYTHSQLHHKPEVSEGFLAERSGALLSEFFQNKRKERNRI